MTLITNNLPVDFTKASDQKGNGPNDLSVIYNGDNPIAQGPDGFLDQILNNTKAKRASVETGYTGEGKLIHLSMER